MKIIWLDDTRSPYNEYSKTIQSLREDDFTEEISNGETVWVKNYKDFVNEISTNGLPDLISFDHDLADEHYHHYMYKGKEYNKLYNTFVEKTGLDCAKWLVEYCTSNSLKLPRYNVHSQNPIGKENIIKLLYNFRNK